LDDEHNTGRKGEMMMRPKLKILSDKLVSQIIDEAYGLLMDPGVRVHNDDALELLAEAGANVDFESKVAHIPEAIAQRTLKTAPPNSISTIWRVNRLSIMGAIASNSIPVRRPSPFSTAKRKNSAHQ